jgi:hypothetical protein
VGFDAGTNGFVTLLNNTGESNKAVVADAMEWIYNPAQEYPGNGMVPPWWGQAYFGTPVNGADDDDGDGYSNYQEFILGTPPNDAAGRLNFSVTHLSSNILQVTFSPWQGGRVYELQRRTNLTSPIWQSLTNQAASNASGEGVFTVTDTAGTNGFYRLGIRYEP